jgi:hypothetical protein
LSAAPATTSSILVAITGVLQDPSTYSVSGTTLTFSPAPPTGTSNISVRFLGIPASGVTTTAYRTVTEFTATSGQTTFSVPSYTVGFIDVYRNGVLLGSADYTASNGLTVVLVNGCTAGDLVEVISFQVSSVLNAIPAVAGAVNSNYIANDVTINFADGSASTPSITNNGDNNTGIFFPAADTIAFAEGGAEVARFNASGNLGLGTASPNGKLDVAGTIMVSSSDGNSGGIISTSGEASLSNKLVINGSRGDGGIIFQTNSSERMRIDSSGRVGVGCVPTGAAATEGIQLIPSGVALLTRTGDVGMFVNRLSNDGQLIQFRQDTVEEGNISVSGTTVSYNGGHLSRYAQTLAPKDDSLLKGTVLSNLDEMNEYIDVDGNPVDNEQLNKVKVSDVEGDANVAGVFVNWSHDTPHDLDEINMAMTGDMIIRIAQGVTVQRGDLLMSAGDGTAKPQGDDIVRSKTIAKVTSTHVTCTYEDGSYCVPCVLMAC